MTALLHLVQGLMLLAAGALIYLMSGYWLADRLEGPNIPIINLDFWALVIVAALIWGAWLIGRHYFAKELGQVTFQGGNWAFSFPYTGGKPTAEVHQVIRTAFVSRGYHKDRRPEQPH